MSDQSYNVVIGKNATAMLKDLQKETGLLYFLIWGDQAVHSGEPSLGLTPSLLNELQQEASENQSQSLAERSVRINEHQYLLANSEIDGSL